MYKSFVVQPGSQSRVQTTSVESMGEGAKQESGGGSKY
jgi:hypothetical protein